MFCVYLLLFCSVITGISSQDDDNLSKETNKCIVPPKDIIKNGKYTLSGYDDDELPPAGEKLYSYVMEVTCNPGYRLNGFYLVQCVTDKSIDPFPKCVAPCKRTSPELLSCGIGFDNEESHCLMSQQQETLATRIKMDSQCGVIPTIFRTTVANGTKAKPEDAPWHAGVYTKTTRPYMQICGGTIISTNVIISAAHCFWNDLQKRLPAENFAVAVGKIYRPWDDPNDANPQKSDIKEIRIPPRFQGRTTNFQDDIALLILETPIRLTDLVTPACLDFDYEFDEIQLKQGRSGRVSGWGLTSADGAASQVLNWAELPVVDIEQCIAQAQPGFIESITSDKICAGFANGTAVCRGDSGGGLLVPDTVGDSYRYYLRGIVSTAPTNEHLCNVYAVATFTHIIKHERFIRNALEAVSTLDSTRSTTQSTITIDTKTDTGDSKESEKGFTVKYPDDNTDISETPVPNPLTNKDTISQIEIQTTTELDDSKQLQEIFNNFKQKKTNVYECDIGPYKDASDCIKNYDSKTKTDESNTNTNDNTSSNIGLQVITEAPDSAPITNPPTFTNDGNFATVNGPDFDNFNKQGDMELPNQRRTNQEILNPGNKNGGDINQGLNNGQIKKGFINQGTSVTQENFNTTGSNKGGITQNGSNQGEINRGSIFQGELTQGHLDRGQQGLQLGIQNQFGLNKGQINKGGISGAQNHNLASQLGLNVGAVVQGASNEGDKVQGGLNQGLATQLGLNVGKISQSGVFQGGKIQSGLNLGYLSQPGINAVGTQGEIIEEAINLGGINQGGIAQGVLSQGVLGQPGIIVNGAIPQGNLNGGGIIQGIIPQTNANQRGEGEINLGHNTYLPPKQIKNPNINGQITVYPTLAPTVIPINVNPGSNIGIKPIPIHPETSTEREDIKTSVLEQYFVTTEPNFQNNYQDQVWQYNSPNYQQNHQNWQWQSWPQKQHDWQNWNSQWEHRQEYPHGYYHHTNKYGGHWWQKYRR